MAYFDTRSVLFGIMFFLLVVGGIASYHAGYYAASKEFYSYYMAESLNDRIIASLYTLYGDMDTDATGGSSEDPDAVSELDTTVQTDLADPKPVQPVDAESSHHYDAYLIGFGARRSADRYAKQLAADNIPAQVVTRDNINARGRKIVWYQVTVGPLPYHQLLEIVEVLKYRDKLEGVVFVEHKL
jgi:hypothetical protein